MMMSGRPKKEASASQGAGTASVLTANVLGRLEIHWDGRALEGTSLRKTEALLIYLALNPGQQGRSRLAGLLWGDSPEDRARANLRHALWDLRRKVDPAAFESDRRSIGLNPSVTCQVDVLQFEAEIEGAAGCRQRGEVAAMIDHLEAALVLYGGDFLEHFDLPDCPEFDEWVMRRRVWLRERALEALTCLVNHHTRQGGYEKALRCARRQLSFDPWREEAHREVMRLLALTGQRSAALAQYETCRRLLDAELGLEPLEETVALYERIRDSYDRDFGDSRPVPPGLPPYGVVNLPFAGRGDEHARLFAWWREAQQGQSRLALVDGEAGVGKTRLVEEVVRYAEAEGVAVLRGRCYEFAAAVPYQPIAEALRSFLREGADEQEGRGAKVRGGRGARKMPSHAISPACLFRIDPLSLRTLAPVWLSELSRLLPQLRQMYPDLPEPVQVSGEAARQRLFEAVARFLRQVADPASYALPPASCLLFLDDLHWADPSTLDLLHYLVRQLTDAPLWIVGTSRPEEVSLSHPLTRLRQGLGRDHMVNHLGLKPLGPEAVAEVARSLVGEEEGARFGDFLYRESEGNPFILTETVSSLREQGMLGRTGDGEGHWQWTGPPTMEVLPLGVRDVVLQRVGRLGEAAQRLLSLAAVVGWRFDSSLLRAASRRDADAVGEAIDGWLARRLVESQPISSPHSPYSSFQYDFSHNKIRAAVYDAIEPARRMTLHQWVAEALEQRRDFSTPGSQIGERVGLLAHHWECAEDLGRAAQYHVRAGDQARLIYAHQEAVDHYRRALAILREQGQLEQAARALMKLGQTYHNAFDFARARSAYDESFALWKRVRAECSAVSLAPELGSSQVLRVRWFEPTTLDPAFVPDGDTRCLISHLFSGLVAMSPTLDVLPDVARAWEMSDGGRRFVFHLRDDVVWSDGTPVTARDFEYAWKRVLDPATGSPAASFLHDLEGARAFHRGEGSREQVAVQARDEVTLVMELERPVGYFLQLLSHVAYFPVPRHVVEDHGEGWIEEGVFVANGPFRLEAWKRGQSLALTRSPAYHGQFRGNLERVEISPVEDWSTRLGMYEAGDLDVLGITYFPAVEREEARQRHAEEYVSGPRLETSYVVFDVSCPPFDDVRVRRAFVMATDRATLANVVLQGYASPATGGFVPPGMPGHSPAIDQPYDPDQAHRLLEEAGYPGGRNFPPLGALVFRAAKSRSDYLARQWQEVLGVEIRWDVLPWAEFLHRLGEEPPRIRVLMWVADYPDPDNFLRVCRDRTWADWHSEAYDRLVEEARRVMGQEERMRLYGEADRILVEEAPILPLTYERDHLLIKPWVSHYPTSALRASFWKDTVVRAQRRRTRGDPVAAPPVSSS
jgi:ABC-type oligopeptide transport system substrate-binding subunit/DNA-binding SARP family transcriptional activator